MSLLGFAVAVFALLALFERGELFSPSLLVVAIQAAAFVLMIWARLTFGRRSFHPGADPTAGELVTRGPYRFLRHPIYAAICYFIWAGVLAHPAPIPLSLGCLATAGLIVRMLCEEALLRARYPEYFLYAKRTRRLLPGLW